MTILDPLAARYAHWLGLPAAADPGEEDPALVRAMQLVLHIERDPLPPRTALLEAAAAAAVAVCLDDRAEPEGEWHDAVSSWVGRYIRKVARRARGAHWRAVQELPGLTVAVDVREVVHCAESGVRVSVTTGIGAHPTWAAGRSAAPEPVGTINAVCWLPVRLSPAALVNAVATVAEAKAQALFEVGVPGTGTPTDAVALLCPPAGPAEPFGGPRSPVGAPLARAVHAAVLAGLGEPGK